ncbi:NADP(H)-dependent aldo-keto reductase [Cardiobacteriaceae bacterium TAE3-ERU3]|nr:NADP(H)-dependent aldo-keto reductase [Cardiobacteriaceae bacterium TAE3-ERU3]
MEFRQLGQTDVQVSKICLGTMTWGEQNSEAEAHAQLDYALEHGVNFIDTAEMYPVPPSKETYTRTEQYIGSWLGKRGKRDDIVLASKIAGPGRSNNGTDYIRGGSTFTREHILAACDASLERLQTDYLDLYQLHWPERDTNFFGRLGLSEVNDHAEAVAFEETLSALKELVDAGKVRHIGLSNETPWGVMQCLRLAEQQGMPRVVSVQNPYNLLNRSYEVGLAEMSIREQVGLLAYSPLAFGVLSGKYRHGAKPEGARLTLFERFQRYSSAQAKEAVERYAKIADDAGISLTHLALAYVNSRQFLTSNIIGATSIEQLVENIASAEVTLSDDTIAAIDAVHAEISNPCP